ncbi:MAG: precorrin-6Y C5,15-methyltransferase (decarboxylating) subunit CbiT [Methanomicrobiaceae archaeon]|nr:precorrin-6Y C5,15-methyltransferase (decarboxylating) subunit CbiT [Methanomicrobiaceae archaeon]
MELKGGPTQDEIMAVSLLKLRIKKGDVMADIGCGTAKISIEASEKCSSIYAIDRRAEAVEYAKREIESAGKENIILIHGEASSVLDEIGTDAFDCAFVGGSGEIELVLEKLKNMVSGRVVVNAVLLNTVSRTVNKMKELGIFREVIHIQVSRSYELVGDIMFKPVNPVYIIVGEVE